MSSIPKLPWKKFAAAPNITEEIIHHTGSSTGESNPHPRYTAGQINANMGACTMRHTLKSHNQIWHILETGDGTLRNDPTTIQYKARMVMDTRHIPVMAMILDTTSKPRSLLIPFTKRAYNNTTVVISQRQGMTAPVMQDNTTRTRMW